MPSGLDTFLGTAIPIAIFIFFIAVIYKAMKEPIDNLFRAIKKLFRPKEEESVATNEIGYRI